MKRPAGPPNSEITNPQGSDLEMQNELQAKTLDYFIQELNRENGLIPDSTAPESPCSIAAVGLALSAYIVGVERSLIERADAIAWTLNTLRFFVLSDQSGRADSTGYRGFYFHFIGMDSGCRAWKSELSTIDTALFIAGVLTAVSYYQGDAPDEIEIRKLGDFLYRRIDWIWALNEGNSISHGWMPESGFLKYQWDRNYSEALLLYILALGSPTFAIETAIYEKWTATFKIRKCYGQAYIFAPPLFIHQLPQVWIDFRDLRDRCNRRHDLDYFENSRRATYVQRSYAVENKLGFNHYSENCWGITASDGPGPCSRKVDGKMREFFGYVARGVPDGPDDGTVSPWAVVASLPFAPDIVLSTLRHAIERLRLTASKPYGLDASFNPTFPESGVNPNGWVAPHQIGLNQGPIILMIENHRTGLIWSLMKNCEYLVDGLLRAGFEGGWLEEKVHGN